MTLVGLSDASRYQDHHDPNLEVCYRVYDNTSASPRRQNGFTATDAEFHPTPLGHISNKEWVTRTYPKYNHSHFFTSTGTLFSILDHVLGGWGGYGGISTGASDWISTTASYDWAIWEVVRRLVFLGREKVRLSTIQKTYGRGYQGSRSITAVAGNAIAALVKRRTKQKEGRPDQVDQVRAMKYSRPSSEVLFFGRIFAKDILQTTTWTKQTPGGYKTFDPEFEAYLVAPKHRQGNCWVDWLIFEKGDSFAVAAMKIQARRDKLETSRRGR